MEGVGARLGRSSTRFGPVTVFTGPVRKWKKKWVHVPPSTSNHHHHQHTPANGAVNGSAAHLCFYKWTPITPSQNKDANNNNGNADSKVSNEDDDVVAAEDPPRKKFKYIPIIVLEEEQNNESSEQIEDEAKPNEIEENAVDLEATSKSDGSNEKPDINDLPMGESKPDINDVPMDESEAPENKPFEQHDLNESPLELSMGSKSENVTEAKEDHVKDEQLE